MEKPKTPKNSLPPSPDSKSGGETGKIPSEPVFTTKGAAKLCKVSLSTIVYWFDKNLIEGYRTPGGHRRIYVKKLEEFLRTHEIPLRGRMPAEKFKVLVVDDEPYVIDFFVKTISYIDPSIEVAAARNGFQAGRLLSTFRPNLVFLDLVMPSLDGFEVCKLIKDDPETRKITVVAITGHCSEEDTDRILNAGFSKLMLKPIMVEDIEMVLSTYIQES